jgi:hypothetical protein
MARKIQHQNKPAHVYVRCPDDKNARYCSTPPKAKSSSRRNSMKNIQRTHGPRWLTRARLLVQVLFALLLTVGVAAQTQPAEPKLQGEGTLKVMTYNMYSGSEYRNLTNPSLPIFLQAATNMLQEAIANDPQGRAQAIARQIAISKPHLVGLQEAATWSDGPSLGNLTVQFDYLQLLLDALAAQGMQYTPVASVTHWDVTLPSTTGFVHNDWRVVIIARADLKPEDFSLTNFDWAPWTNTLVAPVPALGADCQSARIPGNPSCRLPLTRGWVSADVTYRGKQMRFIAAHLDHGALQVAQTLELLNGPANTPLPVIVAADLNCDLSNPSDSAYPGCVNLLNAGFVDAWTAANPNEPGFTKPLFPLNNPNAVMTMRGDYVMVRGRFKVQAAVLAGEEVGDMTSTGLWPSDHCGVIARLQHPGEE